MWSRLDNARQGLAGSIVTRKVLIHVGLPLLGLAATRLSTLGVSFGDFVRPLM